MALAINPDGTFAVDSVTETKFPNLLTACIEVLGQRILAGELTTEEVLKLHSEGRLHSAIFPEEPEANEDAIEEEDLPDAKEVLERELDGKLIAKLSFCEMFHRDHSEYGEGWGFENKGIQFITCSERLLECLTSTKFCFAQGRFDNGPHQRPEVKVEQLESGSLGSIDFDLISSHDIIHSMIKKVEVPGKPWEVKYEPLEEVLRDYFPVKPSVDED